jgi:hypothetical protein
MKRIAALLLLAVWPGSPAQGADPALPTIPRIPPPVVYEEAPVVAASGQADRILAPIRERTGLTLAGNFAPASYAPADCNSCPAPTTARECGTSVIAGSPIKAWLHSAATVPCGTPVCPGSPIKAWLCFRPTTGHALPWLNPHPYVGPIAGTFPCHPVAGCGPNGCAPAGKPACATPGCPPRLGIGLPGRGCNGNGNGICVPPSEGAFPGYRFATPETPAITGKAAYGVPSVSTSYKPAVLPTGVAPTAPSSVSTDSQRSPTVMQALKRTFAKP